MKSIQEELPKKKKGVALINSKMKKYVSRLINMSMFQLELG